MPKFDILLSAILLVGVLAQDNFPSTDDYYDDPTDSPFEEIREPNTTEVSKRDNVYRIPGSTTRTSTSTEPPLDVLLDLYNPNRLSSDWNVSQGLLNETCAENYGAYLTGLASASLWALQMTDASGRYGGGFFWGNPYWLGSATLCRNVNPPPPFELGFYVVKAQIQISSSITPHLRSQLLGLCLPASCQPEDAEKIVSLSVSHQRLEKERSIQLTLIKAPHHVYHVTHDPTFWILAVVTIIVFALVSLGTMVDLYHEWVMDKCKRTSYVYDNYSYEIAKTRHHKDVMSDDDVKVQISANNNENSEGNTPESSERNSVTSDETEHKPSVWCEVILAFSARRNLLTICDRTVGENTIPTVHGLRSLSMAWVILGHTCIIAFKYSDNMSYRALIEKELMFQTINNGAYSVDTFFFISGLLFSFLYFRTTAKHDITKITKTTGLASNFIEFIGMIVYRFCRLTTPYFFVLGVVQVAMKWFHYNSVFEPPATDYINCPKYWWRNLFYINTLFPVKDMCMLWSWYLADDTQFYVLGAILLIIAVKHFKAAFCLLFTFLISSLATTAFIAYNNQHIPNEDDPLALFDKIYDKPWTRLGPYLVGMSVGWILFKTDCKIKFKKITVLVGWVLSMSILLFLVYGLFGSKLNPITGAAFSSLSHTAWTVALGWIVIACSTGYGGYASSILSSSLLYPFSRVTYCAYLVHPIVIRFTAMRMDSPVHLGPEMVTVMFIGELVLSYVIAFVVSLMFEAPVVSLLRLVSPTKRKTK